MPCYQVNTVSVEFKATSTEHLLAALKALGWSYNYDERAQRIYVRNFEIDLAAGKAEITRYQQDYLNELKVAYSTEVVKSVAAKRRWVLKRRAAQKFEARRY